jgi:DDB1- and CUL4-associated factor 6
MLAVSGIDSTVKIFSPDQRARRAAAHAHGVTAADSSTFPSMGRRPQRRRASPLNPQESKELHDGISEGDGDLSDADDQLMRVLEKGLESRRRMHRQYQITSENDMERRSGMHSGYVSRSMWQLLMNSGLGAQMENMEEMSRDAQDCAVM